MRPSHRFPPVLQPRKRQCDAQTQVCIITSFSVEGTENTGQNKTFDALNYLHTRIIIFECLAAYIPDAAARG